VLKACEVMNWQRWVGVKNKEYKMGQDPRWVKI